MPPGAIYSYYSGDKDELELIDAVYVQPHETEHTSQYLLFEASLFEESLIPTALEQSLIPTAYKMKNAREYNLEDIATHPCKKKSKLVDNHSDNGDDFPVNAEDNNNETSQKKQTVAGCSKTTTDTPHASNRCNFFGIIKINGDDGDNQKIRIYPLNEEILYCLKFIEEFDQKVLIERVAGNGFVKNVEVLSE